MDLEVDVSHSSSCDRVPLPLAGPRILAGPGLLAHLCLEHLSAHPWGALVRSRIRGRRRTREAERYLLAREDGDGVTRPNAYMSPRLSSVRRCRAHWRCPPGSGSRSFQGIQHT